MRNFFAWIFLFVGLIAICAIKLDVMYWASPPEKKFSESWISDLKLLKKTGHFPDAWKSLAAIDFSSTDTQVQNWYRQTPPPFTTHPDGRYKLQILGIHLIEGYRYGVVLQYNWIDLKSGNTIGEFARTLKLGLVY